ncbi:MAG TPA: STAS domain-containing protein [Rhizomicrobium sp.]|jgi:anti-anti-sigma regulatory factor|nr:STAS domain-containing protein [Rhizomicrobium sp.]
MSEGFDAQAVETMQLASILDLTAAAGVKHELAAMLARSNSILLDASAVQRITTPVLQVLVSAAHSAKAAGGEIRISDPSSAFTDTIRLLSLGDTFGKIEAQHV